MYAIGFQSCMHMYSSVYSFKASPLSEFVAACL